MIWRYKNKIDLTWLGGQRADDWFCFPLLLSRFSVFHQVYCLELADPLNMQNDSHTRISQTLYISASILHKYCIHIRRINIQQYTPCPSQSLTTAPVLALVKLTTYTAVDRRYVSQRVNDKGRRPGRQTRNATAKYSLLQFITRLSEIQERGLKILWLLWGGKAQLCDGGLFCQSDSWVPRGSLTRKYYVQWLIHL